MGSLKEEPASTKKTKTQVLRINGEEAGNSKEERSKENLHDCRCFVNLLVRNIMLICCSWFFNPKMVANGLFVSIVP